MTALPQDMLNALRLLQREGAGQDLGGRSQAISRSYRSFSPSRSFIAERADVLAYALSRLPATFGAAARVFEEVSARSAAVPLRSMLDVGAGPGTASWAAAEVWPGLEQFTLLDHNLQFLRLAGLLAAQSPFEALRYADIRRADMGDPIADKADLVVACYALTELPDQAYIEAGLRLWSAAQTALVIIEPGRPRDYQRMMSLRSALFAAGAEILAPCPHQRACPLMGEDWCHFSARVARSREHRHLKGATLGYEDEKFSYLAVVRPGRGAVPAPARIIKPPHETKFSVQLPLCAGEGLLETAITKRDSGFKAARKLRWGDAFTSLED